MSTFDLASKRFFNQNDVFASFINCYVLKGGMTIDADSLVDCPTEHILSCLDTNGGQDGLVSTKLVQRHRDLLKRVSIKTCYGLIYALAGLELQSYSDYAMPIRVMQYDAMLLASEVARIANTNRSKRLLDSNIEGEYLSGFRQIDRITPVITTVVNLNDEPWTGPTTLSELYDIPAECRNILAFCPEYKINVISLSNNLSNDINKLDRKIEFIANCINVRKDKTKELDLWHRSWNNPEITEETWDLAFELTGVSSPLESLKKEKKMRNPEVWPYVRENLKRIFYSEARAEGKAEGKAEGITQGRNEGITQGRLGLIIEIGTTLCRNGTSFKEAVAQICSIVPSLSSSSAEEILKPVYG